MRRALHPCYNRYYHRMIHPLATDRCSSPTPIFIRLTMLPTAISVQCLQVDAFGPGPIRIPIHAWDRRWDQCRPCLPDC